MMAKYSKRIVNRICDLIAKDTYTVAEICAIVKISESCYYKWQAENVEFTERVKEARHKFDESILSSAKKSLVKLIEGYEYEEKKTITIDDGQGRPKIKEQSIVKKHVSPSLGAIIHFQTNKAPDEWKNRQNTEITGKDGKDLIPARVLSKDEMQDLMNELKNDY